MGLQRLVMFGLLGYLAVITVGAGWVADRNLQKCWAKHGVSFACKGDGRYDPRFLTRPMP